MLEPRQVPLPGTSWFAGTRARTAWLRPLTGWDELAVAEEQDDRSGVELGLLLAGRCLIELRDGEGSALGHDWVAAALSVGDREALLLSMRQQALGDRVALVATCPDMACGQVMDLDLSIASVLSSSLEQARPEVTVRPGLVLRRPNGADQLAVARLALDDPVGAAVALLRRCVLVGELEDDDVDAASEALDRADPQAGCELALTCPVCSTAFTTQLDAAELLRREVGSQRELDVAVHLLASHYHWSEEAILALPLRRRRRHVEVLSDALSAAQGSFA